MKIGVLTSSRADFGIYLPLLKSLENDSFFELQIIAFGTHLSDKHGRTIREIENTGFTQIHQLNTMPSGDSPEAIAKAIAKGVDVFSHFWSKNTFDIVLALGDRFEMFAAVSAASPFMIQIAHIHAGETTLGAIDNAYRHSISLFATNLFVSNSIYAERAKEVVGDQAKVHIVGALSIDNLSQINYLGPKELQDKFGINMSKPSILSTFHPETVAFESNEGYVKTLIEAFQLLIERYQIIITLPNADTMGTLVRDELLAFAQGKEQVVVVESLGMLGYLSVMKHCKFLLGNSSSAYVEASYFPKPVIDLGNRQDGRIVSSHIRKVEIEKQAILAAVEEIERMQPIKRDTALYGDGHAAKRIVEILKTIHGR